MEITKLLRVPDAYERKARLAPAVLTVIPAIVLVLSLNLPTESWVIKCLGAGGVGGLLIVGLTQFASTAGNQFGKKFWEKKGGLPTNAWLRRDHKGHATAQKEQWYAAIKRLTGLDIFVVIETRPDEEDAVINDALNQVRHKLRGKAMAKMLETHNQEYGFARNLAGMRWLLIGIAIIGLAGCGLAWVYHRGSAWGTLVNGLLTAIDFCFFIWLPGYVERAGVRYAESFFPALLAVAGKTTKQDTSVP